MPSFLIRTASVVAVLLTAQLTGRAQQGWVPRAVPVNPGYQVQPAYAPQPGYPPQPHYDPRYSKYGYKRKKHWLEDIFD